MGAETLASTMLMFIAVMGMTVGVVILLTNYITQTSTAVTAKQKSLVGQLETDISIISVNSSATKSDIYVKNLGSSDMLVSCMNVIIDEEPIDTGNFSILDSDSETAVTLWNATKTLLINTTHVALSSSTTHQAKIITCNGVTTSYIFSI